MGLATLGPFRFRLDPHTVTWDYTITAVDVPTVGGKVVQVLGSHLGDMTVTGSFGTGGWREQARFLEAMKTLGDQQVAAQQVSRSTFQPFRFKYPPKGWDFGVYLTNYTQPGARGSVQLDNTTTAPQWQLTLFIVEGAQALKKVAQDVFIARLSAGLGWKQTEFNGPMTMADVEQALSGQSLVEYISQGMGVAPVSTTSGGGGGRVGGSGTGIGMVAQ